MQRLKPSAPKAGAQRPIPTQRPVPTQRQVPTNAKTTTGLTASPKAQAPLAAGQLRRDTADAKVIASEFEGHARRTGTRATPALVKPGDHETLHGVLSPTAADRQFVSAINVLKGSAWVGQVVAGPLLGKYGASENKPVDINLTTGKVVSYDAKAVSSTTAPAAVKAPEHHERNAPHSGPGEATSGGGKPTSVTRAATPAFSGAHPPRSGLDAAAHAVFDSPVARWAAGVTRDVTRGTAKNVETLGQGIAHHDPGKVAQGVAQLAREASTVPVYLAQQTIRGLNGLSTADWSKELQSAVQGLQHDGDAVRFGQATEVGGVWNPVATVRRANGSSTTLGSGQLGYGGRLSTSNELTITQRGEGAAARYRVTADFADQGGAVGQVTAKFDGKALPGVSMADSETASATASADANLGSASRGTYQFESKADATRGGRLLNRYFKDRESLDASEKAFLEAHREAHTQTATVSMRATAGGQLNLNLLPFGSTAGGKPGFVRFAAQGQGTVSAEQRSELTYFKASGGHPARVRVALTTVLSGQDAVSLGGQPRAPQAKHPLGRGQVGGRKGPSEVTGTRTISAYVEYALRPDDVKQIKARDGKVTPELAAAIVAERTRAGVAPARAGFTDTQLNRESVGNVAGRALTRHGESTYRRLTAAAEVKNPSARQLAQLGVLTLATAAGRTVGPEGKPTDFVTKLRRSGRLSPVVQLEVGSQRLIREGSGDVRTQLSAGIADKVNGTVTTTSRAQRDRVTEHSLQRV